MRSASTETRGDHDGRRHPTLASRYSLVTVPLFTPRDTGHAIPRALAAVLVVIGFAVS